MKKNAKTEAIDEFRGYMADFIEAYQLRAKVCRATLKLLDKYEVTKRLDQQETLTLEIRDEIEFLPWDSTGDFAASYDEEIETLMSLAEAAVGPKVRRSYEK